MSFDTKNYGIISASRFKNSVKVSNRESELKEAVILLERIAEYISIALKNNCGVVEVPLSENDVVLLSMKTMLPHYSGEVNGTLNKLGWTYSIKWCGARNRHVMFLVPQEYKV